MTGRTDREHPDHEHDEESEKELDSRNRPGDEPDVDVFSSKYHEEKRQHDCPSFPNIDPHNLALRTTPPRNFLPVSVSHHPYYHPHMVS